MTMMAKLVGVTGLAAIAVTVFWIVGGERQQGHAFGRKLYSEHCASCHGLQLQGQPDWQTPKTNGRLPAPPHDATGHTWHHSDTELFQISKYGMSAVVPSHQSDMPGFGSILSDEQIVAILDFIKSTWPTREREYQRARNRNPR